MNKKLAIGVIGLVAFANLGAAQGCEADPRKSDQGPNVPTYDNGKHYISAIGKWKYGTTVAPSNAKFPQCRWSVWGLQKDGWKKLYSGKSTDKAKLPPEGVYASAYLESRGCGKWSKK